MASGILPIFVSISPSQGPEKQSRQPSARPIASPRLQYRKWKEEARQSDGLPFSGRRRCHRSSGNHAVEVRARGDADFVCVRALVGEILSDGGQGARPPSAGCYRERSHAGWDVGSAGAAACGNLRHRADPARGTPDAREPVSVAAGGAPRRSRRASGAIKTGPRPRVRSSSPWSSCPACRSPSGSGGIAIPRRCGRRLRAARRARDSDPARASAAARPVARSSQAISVDASAHRGPDGRAAAGLGFPALAAAQAVGAAGRLRRHFALSLFRLLTVPKADNAELRGPPFMAWLAILSTCAPGPSSPIPRAQVREPSGPQALRPAARVL